MNGRNNQSFIYIVNQAIDTYEKFLQQLKEKEPKPRNGQKFKKIKNFLFKQVF